MESYSRLYAELQAYVEQGRYPLHMPGHKRRLAPVPGLGYCWDMTEVPGVDDLHEADGILREAMERTARLHGAARTWYLVNGSTCGLLAGIRALAPRNATLICARNCHKAVYHAIELGNLSVRWLTPPLLKEGVCGSISPEAVETALQETPEAACVVLTSPTYEGVLSEIGRIAAICHKRGVPLLVDEAHGAHLGLGEGWPASAVQSGADVVIQSAHKTLPSLTQTALLHLSRGSLADPEEVERQLGVFETSSPSYLLMASLDGCTGLLEAEGVPLLHGWLERLHRFDRKIQDLKRLSVLGHQGDKIPGIFAFDPSKLPISTAGTDLSGGQLAQRLREGFGFETEMAQGDICLAMTGMGDQEEVLDRLAQVLHKLDREAALRRRPATATLPAPGQEELTMAEAILAPGEEIPLENGAGRIAGEYLWAYPPGIPLTAPGERLTPEFLAVVEAMGRSGTELHHSHCKKAGFLRVLS